MFFRNPLSLVLLVLFTTPSPAAPTSQPTAATTPATVPALSAAGKWQKLKTEPFRGKQDDLCFPTPKTGFYVNGDGKIYKTVDAGETWTLVLHKPGTFFRCIGFVDENLGFAGNIGPGYFPNVTDTNLLYKTTDGGTTWNAIPHLPGTTAADPSTTAALQGLCAIDILRTPFINAGNLDYKTRIFAGGRVGGPGALLVSDDLGLTWQILPVEGLTQMVLDVHFLDDEHGILAGASDTNVAESHAVILTTADGGKSWTKRYESTRPYEVTWKISFPTKTTGYVTIQSYNPDPAAAERFLAKTTDGGTTWIEIPLVTDSKVREFGVGFVSDDVGFVGATPGGFATTDGGNTWTPINFGNAVNKIRIVPNPDRTATLYAIGVGIHKITLAVP